MGEGNAWVTLATNDSYSLGALVLAHSLRRVATKHQLVILVTPGVTPIMRERLSSVFSKVITVDVLDSGDAAHLALLARPELGITFTKLHCWTLTDYSKCVFLDADTLILQNCDELFDREELSAAPDVGWPDCFNSGVFVYRPSNETFQSLLTLAKEKGSFDGGDQGLLNQYFSDWARGDISKHLPFLYNVCSTAFYSYLPALQQYGSGMKIIHFIGNVKPWLQSFNWASRNVSETGHLQAPLQYWWDIFLENVHPTLDAAMAGVAGALSQLTIGASEQSPAVEEHLRRQGWEAGNIDYMGADAFENIWAKISQTLSGPTEAATPPPQPQAPAVIETPATPLSPEPAIAPVLASAPVESAPPAAEPVPSTPISEVVPILAEAPAAPVEPMSPAAEPVPEAAQVAATEVEACPLKQVPSEASSGASGDSWVKVAEKPAVPEPAGSDLSLSGTTVSSVASSLPSQPEPEPQVREESGEETQL